jgi:pSer/pThr/pTyr-binding forkhead associated (FHA) protein
VSVRYQIVMRSGPNPGATYPLEVTQTTLGRDGSNTISINDAEVSRHHARMTLQGGKIVLEDLGSTNGTSVNGNRISGPHVLKAGEMISLGEDIVFVFEAESFDPDATVVSSAAAPIQSQPSAVPRQQPVPPQTVHPQAYAGQVPEDPIPQTPPPSDAIPGKRNTLPIVLAISALIILCSCGAFFWWVDATYRWCTFFPFIAGC